MTRSPALSRSAPPLLAALLAALLLSACWPFGGRGGSGRFAGEVAEILEREDPSADFYRDRSRLERMGAELDAVLAALIDDPGVDEHVRANAVALLADRRSPVAVPLLRRSLVSSNSDAVRAAAVVALQRLADDDPSVRAALRAAVDDPARRVRLNALQGLGVEDAELIRRRLEVERDPQVRLIARQLLSLLESRGAPLVADESGDLRTLADDSLPQIVFHPAVSDRVADRAAGALWVEMADGEEGSRLVPLAQEVEVIGGIVPAFFDPRHTAVVYEADRAIHVRDLRTGRVRRLGPGIAPRTVPFTDAFVFLEEQPELRTEAEEGTVLTYDVLFGSFSDNRVRRIGRLQALLRRDAAGVSPVRRLRVGEYRQAFVLLARDVSAFVLPNPFGAGGRPIPQQ